MCAGGERTNGLGTGKGLVRTFIYMNTTSTPNRHFHLLTSSFATTAGRLVVPMRSLVTKLLAVTTIVVVAGTTVLAPSAAAWSSADDAVAIVVAGSSWGNMRDVAVADDGSIYACGHFRGSTDLDPDPTNAVTVNPGGSNQPGLVVKMNPEGNYEWHATVDTPNGSISSCVVAGDGSVYATGFFRSTGSVVAGDVHTTGLASNKDNAFVAKFSPAGTGEWLRSVGASTSSSTSYGYGVDVDAAGNVYVTGRFLKTVDLDLDAGSEDLHATNGGQWNNTFFVKLDAAGNTQWSHSWGGVNNTIGRAVVVDNAGDIVVGGWTHPIHMDLDPDPAEELLVGINSNDSNNQNMWMSKFDTTGDLVWGHWFGSNSTDAIYDIDVDAANNIYITGFAGTKGRVASGGNWQTNLALPPIVVHGIAHRDIVTAKFDPSGTTQWVKIYGGSSKWLYGLGIAVTGDAVYSVGYFNNTVDFSRGVDPAVFNAGTSRDPFLVRHNAADGSFVCAATIEDVDSNKSSEAQAVAVDSAGNVYMSGYFHKTVDFDPRGEAARFTSLGSSEGFVARYSPACALGDADVAVAPTPPTPPSFTVAGTPIVVSEAATAASSTVVLDTAPTGTVVFDVTHTDNTEAVASPTTLAFDASNWDVPQTVTITGVNDDLDDGTTVSHVIISVNDDASDDAWDGLADQTVNVTTTDDDTAGITLSGTSIVVSETGTAGSVTVVLDSEPTADVTFTVSGSDASEAAVAPSTITFTAGNWNVVQDVTVTGVDDVATDGPVTSTVSLTPLSADSAYTAMAALVINVTTTDDDTAGITVSQSDGSTVVSEAGSTDSVTVVLNTEPTTTVTVTVALSASDEASVDTTELIFTPGNWNVVQDVAVTGVDDGINDGDQVTTLTLSIDGAAAYTALADQTVNITTTDDDTAGFTVSTSVVTVSEAGTAGMIELALSIEPTGTVVVSAAVSDPSEATVAPAVAIFTALNWDVAQTLIVTGLDDTLDDGDVTSTLVLSVVDAATSADEFDSVSDVELVIVTTDDDEPTVEEPTVEEPIVEEPIVVAPEPIVDPGTVDMTVDSLCSAVQVVWAPDVDGEIQSFVLASKAPGAAWTAHSTHTAATDRITIGGLVDGTHAFRVMTVLVDGSPVESDVLPVEVSSCAPVIPDVDEVTVEPIVEDVVVEPIADEVTVEPIVEDVVVVPIADEVTVEPIVDEDPVEPIVEDVVVEPVEENDTDDTVLIQGAPQTPNGGEGPSNGTNPEANNTSPGTSGTGTDGNSRTSSNLNNDGTVESGFSEGARSPLSSSTLATAAGIAAAAGLGLSGVGARLGTALLRFLGSTGAGLFLIGLFRRDRRPGAPENFVIFSSGQITNLVWTAPTAGKAPERYIVEGSVNGYWREVFEFGTNACRAGVPTSEVQGICDWRLRAANEHGVGKPSNEAILEAGTAEATTDLPMAA